MDFSKYGTPSKQWLAFEAANASAAHEGSRDNDPSGAKLLREKTNASRKALQAEQNARAGVDDKVDISTIQVPTRDGSSIPLRRIVPRSRDQSRPLRAMIFLRGGGMLFGTETSDDYPCAEFATSLNACVLSVVYRHTADSQFPTQTNDGLDAFDYILKHAEDLNIDLESGIALVANSAGALIATAMVLQNLQEARKRGRKTIFSGLVLTTPWLIDYDNFPLDLFSSPEKCSRNQCSKAPVLPSERLEMFSHLIGAPSPQEPLMNPGLVPDEALIGWPKTGLVVAGMDILRDDALYFAKRLEALKVRTSVHIFPGLPHGFRKWEAIPAAAAFDDRTIDCIGWALNMCGPKMVGWHEYQEEH